ncbi:MAG: hypothetical protein ACYDFU_10045, partial [Nitrospirota bacterium]
EAGQPVAAGLPAAWGTYIHGIFENDGFRQGLLSGLRQGPNRLLPPVEYAKLKERAFESLADLVESNIDMNEVLKLIK